MKSRTIKIRLVLLVIVMLILCICIGRCAIFQNTGSILSSIETFFSSETTDNTWNLILVNGDHTIPDDYTPELTTLSNGRQIDSRIYPNLQKMFDDMRAEGIDPVVGEGYRTAQQQADMMTEQIDIYLAEGYSQLEAESLAASMVAQPGHSEHQLGLAVDINANKSVSTNDQVYTWLAENAWAYGFILRYPADKTDITGIAYEPWHYRYVGIKEAKEIYEKRICLEEYVGAD